MKNDTFQFGKWQVNPLANTISQGAITRQLEPRAMEVLAALCARAGTVVSIEDLLKQCWGNVIHGENPVHKAIAQLRRALGDSAAAPGYIETIRKRGYRTLACVAGAVDPQPCAGIEALRALAERVAAVFHSSRISEQDRLAFVAAVERMARPSQPDAQRKEA
jgi:DNA-binding winged helix-turn-helix (wHTH) protein